MSQKSHESESQDKQNFGEARPSLIPTPVIDLLAARKKKKNQKQKEVEAAKAEKKHSMPAKSNGIWFGFARVVQVVFVVIATLYILRSCGRI